MGEFTLIQINDSHAYLYGHPEAFAGPQGVTYREAGGYARIRTLVSALQRQRECLFLDCGDTLHGTRAAVASRGRILVPLLNRLGIQAMTGHWEFAYGPAGFHEIAQELSYPVLACNVYDERTGASLFPPYALFEVAGLRVAVIGIASNIVDKTMPPAFSAGAFFTLGTEVVGALARRVRRDERADVVVLLSHLGLPQDLKLLQQTTGIDVCLSGHTHNRLFSPYRVGDTLVVQSGSHGSFLGRLDLSVEHGRVTGFRHELIEVGADVPPDPDMAASVAGALEPYAEARGERLGEALGAFDRFRMWESTADNLLLEAVAEATGIPLALTNAWRYGAPIVPGPVTRGALEDLVPMNPPVSSVTLTGAEIRALIEQNLERTFAADPFAQMGGYVKRAHGLKAYIKLENPPGERVQALYIGSRRARDEAHYEAAFLTEQAVPAGFGTNRRALGRGAADVLCEFVRRAGRVAPACHDTYHLL